MNQPRRHHYVAQMYLAGFTNTGTKDGQLWVADLKRKHEWRCKPEGVAHSRDFYRLEIPEVDPFVIERSFGELEGEFAAVIQDVIANKRFVSEADLSFSKDFAKLGCTNCIGDG